jgi:hypothetical protein
MFLKGTPCSYFGASTAHVPPKPASHLVSKPISRIRLRFLSNLRDKGKGGGAPRLFFQGKIEKGNSLS